MDENELRWEKQSLKNRLEQIGTMIKGLNDAIMQGWHDAQSIDVVTRAQAWVPDKQEQEQIDALAQKGRAYLEELKKVEEALRKPS